MYKDMGESIEGTVLGNASAALAVIQRRGLGKLRHLDTNYVWVQEVAARKQLEYQKVYGKENAADLFTKRISWDEIAKHVEKIKGDFSIYWLGLKPDKDTEKRIMELAKKNKWKGKLAAWQRTDFNAKTA